MNINDLYNTAREGNSAQKDQLFQLLTTRFRLFVRQRIGDSYDVEEIVQDTLMVIYSKYENIEFTTSFSAWAYKVLDNRILAYLQKKSRRARKESSIPDGVAFATEDASSPDLDLRRRIIDCLQKVADINLRYARILNFHHQGYTTEEICRKLSLKPSNLYSILFRARAMMEKCLEKGVINNG